MTFVTLPTNTRKVRVPLSPSGPSAGESPDTSQLFCQRRVWEPAGAAKRAFPRSGVQQVRAHHREKVTKISKRTDRLQTLGSCSSGGDEYAAPEGLQPTGPLVDFGDSCRCRARTCCIPERGKASSVLSSCGSCRLLDQPLANSCEVSSPLESPSVCCREVGAPRCVWMQGL